MKSIRTERPRNSCPITLIIDDPTPCINPLYYFALQVPKSSTDYHYTKKDGKFYFDSDTRFNFPIAKEVDESFVHEFASWVKSTEVRGKFSLIPFPAGLGRVDKGLGGFPNERVEDFLETVRNVISPKFDICPELLTHTRALDLRTKKLRNGVSEHDWSQKQKSKNLTKYIGFAFEILKNAGLTPSGVTSPCNFGMFVEGNYVTAISDAGREILSSNLIWYFLDVDAQSLNVQHKIMRFDAENGSAIVSIIGSMNDPFWGSQFTSLGFDEWSKEKIDPILCSNVDGSISGRISDLVNAGSYATIVTHWQSLYSNGSRLGLKSLTELVTRINSLLGEKILWLTCSEIAQYVASTVSAKFRVIADEDNRSSMKIEISSPFDCRDFTFSFGTDMDPIRLILISENNYQERELNRVSSTGELRPNSWYLASDGRTFVCLAGLEKRQRRISYGVTKKIKKTMKKNEYCSTISVSA